MREKIYTVRSIVSAAEKAAKMTPGTLSGTSRHRPILIWRTAVYVTAKSVCHSFTAIGRGMGRDRASVMSAIKRLSNRAPEGERDAVAQAVEAIEVVLRDEHAPLLERTRQLILAFTSKSQEMEAESRHCRAAAQERQVVKSERHFEKLMAERKGGRGTNVEPGRDRWVLEMASKKLLAALAAESAGGDAC
jgi:hypothetical protein